jgi:CRISPR/Cas system-associated exonuclease Cas4 (RecB family)
LHKSKSRNANMGIFTIVLKILWRQLKNCKHTTHKYVRHYLFCMQRVNSFVQNIKRFQTFLVKKKLITLTQKRSTYRLDLHTYVKIGMLCKTSPGKINGFIRPMATSIHLTLPVAMNTRFPNAIKNTRETFTSCTEGAAVSIKNPFAARYNSQHLCRPTFPS